MAEGSQDVEAAGDPRRTSYGDDYWLRRCEGFVVEKSTKRIGRVAGMRFSERSNEPALLEVRTGFLGRRLLISVDEIAEIAPESSRIVLKAT